MAINRKYSSGADGVLLNDRDLDEIRKYGQAWNEASQRGTRPGCRRPMTRRRPSGEVQLLRRRGGE